MRRDDLLGRAAPVVILVSLAAPVARYAIAFQRAEPALRLFGLDLDVSPITGLAFGLSYEAAAYLGIEAAAGARKRGLKTWWWPAAGSALQVLAGAGIVVPVLALEILGRPLASLPTVGLYVWCALVAGASALTFATSALAFAVQPQKREVKPLDSNTSAPPARSTATRASYTCPLCGYRASSKPALSGHMSAHSAEERARLRNARNESDAQETVTSL